MQDPDTINEENAINYRIILEERKIKNKILRMSDPAKKMTAWRKHFVPLAKPDDSYLLGNIF